MSDPTPTRSRAADGPAVPAILLFVATLSSMAWQGFDFPVDNNAFHVPIVLDYAHSAEGPADAFHRSLDRYVSGLWPLLAPVASESNVYALFLGIHIAVRFFTAFLIWRIAILFGGSSPLSVVFACFILFFDTFVGRSPLGRSEIMVGYLTHSQVVVPVILGAWWFLFQRRFLAAAALLGIAFNINAFAAVWGAAATGVVMIVELRREKLHALLKAMGGASGLFLACAAPTGLWILRALDDVGPYEPFSFGQYVREYYGYHYFVDLQWKAALTFLLAAGAGFVLLRTAGANWLPSRHRPLLTAFAAYGAIVVLGAAAPYLLDHRLVFALHPLRMDSYVVLLLGVIALAWCIDAFRTAGPGERAYALIALFSLINGNMPLLLMACTLARGGLGSGPGAWLQGLLWIAMAAVHGAFGTAVRIEFREGLIDVVFLLLQAGVITYALLKDREQFRNAPVLVAAVLLGFLPAIEGTVSLVLVLGVYGALFLYIVQGRHHGPLVLGASGLLVAVIAREMAAYWLLIGGLALLVPLLSIAPGAAAEKLLAAPKSPDRVALSVLLGCFLVLGPLQMSARGGLSHAPAGTRAYAEAQHWARRNTPPHTLFLPVDVNGFSTLSRRPIWADWQMGGMVMWAPEAYSTWSRRWEAVKKIRSVADAAALAKKEGIGFVVFDKKAFRPGGVANACIAYENERFWIMKVC